MRKPPNFHSLLHSADLLERQLTQMLGPLGIRPRQARILDALSKMGEVSHKALADSFGVTPGSVSTMIDRLEKAGLVHHRSSRFDRRVALVSITKAGAEVLEDVKDVWDALDRLVVDKIGAENAAHLTDLTRELKFALGGKVPPSPESVEEARAATERELKAAQAVTSKITSRK